MHLSKNCKKEDVVPRFILLLLQKKKDRIGKCVKNRLEKKAMKKWVRLEVLENYGPPPIL
jgi:hypothetical protein